MAPMDVEDRDESDTVSEAGDLQQNDADDAEADVVPEEADVTLGRYMYDVHAYA